MLSVTVKCNKCHREILSEKALHWAHFRVDSSYFSFDDGTVDEVTDVDLCPACKKMLNGFLNNCEFTPAYKTLWDEQKCCGKVNLDC